MRYVLVLTALFLFSAVGHDAYAQPGESDPQTRYEQEAIYWGQGLLLRLEGQRSLSATSFLTARKGKYGPELSTAEFYDAVGEPELASEYRLHNGLKWGLGAGLGGALILGGLALIIVPGLDYDGESLFSDTPRLVGASAMVALGTVGLLIATFLDVDSHTTGEKRRMSDVYNRQLRKRLSAEAPDPVASSGAGPGSVDLRWTPTVSLDGLGLALSGSF